MSASEKSGGDRSAALALVGLSIVLGAIVLAVLAFGLSRIGQNAEPATTADLGEFNLTAQPGERPYTLSVSELDKIAVDGEQAFEELTFFPDLDLQPYPSQLLAQKEKLQLTSDQESQLEELRDRSQQELQDLARQVSAREKTLQELLAQAEIDSGAAQQATQESAALYGQLRAAVLKRQLEILNLLTKEQIVLLSDNNTSR